MHQNHLYNFESGHHGIIHVKLHEIWTSGSKDVVKRHFLSRALTADPNLLCNFDRRYHEEQSFEIILNLDQWFRGKCRLKVFLIWISGSPIVQQSITICAILVEDIMRNNSVKLF